MKKEIENESQPKCYYYPQFKEGMLVTYQGRRRHGIDAPVFTGVLIRIHRQGTGIILLRNGNGPRKTVRLGSLKIVDET